MHSCTSWCGTASRLLKRYISIWKDMLQEVLQMPLRLSQNLVVINKSACSRGEIYSRKKTAGGNCNFWDNKKTLQYFVSIFATIFESITLRRPVCDSWEWNWWLCVHIWQEFQQNYSNVAVLKVDVDEAEVFISIFFYSLPTRNCWFFSD